MAFGQTNYNDPRFQRALLRAGSAPRGKQRGLVNQITGEFANQQLAKDLQFAAIFDRRKAFKDDLALREKYLGLHERGLGLRGKGIDLQGKGIDLQGKSIDLQGKGVDLRGKGIDLRDRKLVFEQDLYEDYISDEKKGLNITTAAGLGGGILSYMQNRERSRLLVKDAREERRFLKELKSEKKKVNISRRR